MFDKSALVTGGNSGIGRAVAVLFAREGANVATTYLPTEKKDARITAEAVMEQVRECLLLEGDLRSPKFCKSTVKETVHTFGSPDVLVNNAEYQQSLGDITVE